MLPVVKITYTCTTCLECWCSIPTTPANPHQQCQTVSASRNMSHFVGCTMLNTCNQDKSGTQEPTPICFEAATPSEGSILPGTGSAAILILSETFERHFHCPWHPAKHNNQTEFSVCYNSDCMLPSKKRRRGEGVGGGGTGGQNQSCNL